MHGVRHTDMVTSAAVVWAVVVADVVAVVSIAGVVDQSAIVVVMA